MTHTYVVLQVSPEAYTEIQNSLERAGYGHAFVDDIARGPLIDMHGIALALDASKSPAERVRRGERP